MSLDNELTKLKELLDSGALTQAEFDEQKKKLIEPGPMSPPDTPDAPPAAKKKPIYKKFWFWLLLVIALIIIIVAASGGNDSEKKPSGDEQALAAALNPTTEKHTTTTTPKNQAFSLNQPAELRDFTITAIDVKSDAGSNQFILPADGNTFLAVKFEVENTSNSAQSVFSTAMFTAYADDTLAPFSTSAATALGDLFFGGGLDAGKKMILWYAIEVPSNWITLEIKAQDGILFSSQSVVFRFTR